MNTSHTTKGVFATQHGMKRTRFYKLWELMKYRCKTKPEYAGRGIKCLWKSFEAFKHDMYGSYLRHVERFGESDTTIDRINNSGHYQKSNCHWATKAEQQRNTRRNQNITIKGVTKCATDWARQNGLKATIVMKRLHYGWNPIEAVTRPARPRRSKDILNELEK